MLLWSLRWTFLLFLASLFVASTGAAVDDAVVRLADLPKARAISGLLQNPTLRSAEGRELVLYEFAAKGTGAAPKEPPYRFLVQGGLHGNEEETTGFVLWLARRYARGQSLLNQLPQGEVAIDFLPVANPDGAQRQKRLNARGVNLNRNFTVLWGLTREYPGEQGLSEPETQAIAGLFAARPYTAAVDVHGYINWVVAPSSPDDLAKRGRSPSRQEAALYEAWTKTLRRELELLPGYQLHTSAGLGDGGAFEDWAFWGKGTLAFCLELESLQRYAHAEGQAAQGLPELAPTGDRLAIDLYKRYEAYIFRMFQQAIQLRQGGGRP